MVPYHVIFHKRYDSQSNQNSDAELDIELTASPPSPSSIGTGSNGKKKTDRFSIVISGWPAVGKTTMASELAKEFGLTTYNGGDILKMLASEQGYSTSRDDWWDTKEAKEFMEERKRNSSFDKEVDRRLVEILEKENAVITSYTVPWLVVQGPIKFWLKGSPENRALRMANRDGIPISEARKIIALRDEENTRIYSKLYGFTFGQDLTVFDYVLNTDQLGLDSLIRISKSIVRELVTNK